MHTQEYVGARAVAIPRVGYSRPLHGHAVAKPGLLLDRAATRPGRRTRATAWRRSPGPALRLHLHVQREQRLAVQLRVHGVERGHAGRAQRGLVHQRQHVLQAEDVLRVGQRHQAVLTDRRVGGEQVARVHRVLRERRLGQRAAGVQRLEGDLRGLEAVGLLQAEDALERVWNSGPRRSRPGRPFSAVMKSAIDGAGPSCCTWPPRSCSASGCRCPGGGRVESCSDSGRFGGQFGLDHRRVHLVVGSDAVLHRTDQAVQVGQQGPVVLGLSVIAPELSGW